MNPIRSERLRARALSLGVLSAVAMLAGCRQDMHNQPKMIPQRGTTFFADGRSARPQVANTVARGQLRADEYFYTGMVKGANGYMEERDQMPFPATLTVLKRGQERYNIYCTPCHSRVGNGAGMIVQRGYKPAGNFHDEVRRVQPLSHYFYVMTNGYGAMPDYSAQLTPEDRWAVAAYIRALQLSQNAKETDVPAGTHIENLGEVAQQEGYPASFAGPWEMPNTAVHNNPGKAGTGTPAMAPPGDPEIPKINLKPGQPQSAGPNRPSGNPAAKPASK
jgi:mono/diheme cytochrome c family protein